LGGSASEQVGEPVESQTSELFQEQHEHGAPPSAE
jgi:segregation and condensation protein B